MNQAEANRLADLYNLLMDYVDNWKQPVAGLSYGAGRYDGHKFSAYEIEKVLEANGYELS